MIIENLYSEDTTDIPKYNVTITLYDRPTYTWDEQTEFLKIEKIGGFRLKYKVSMKNNTSKTVYNILLPEGTYLLTLDRSLKSINPVFDIYLTINNIKKLLVTDQDLFDTSTKFDLNIDNYNILPVDKADIKNLTVDKIMFKGHENIPLSIYEHKKFDDINSLSLGNKIPVSRYFENNNKSATKTANSELSSLFFSYPFKK